MRKRFEQQRKLGIISISEVKLPTKSRDELPPILRALQHIFVTPELNEEVFGILEARGNEGEEDREIWDGIVAYIGIIGSEIRVRCGL